VKLVGLVGYYWMLGRVATVFQVDLDVAQGIEVYDAGSSQAVLPWSCVGHRTASRKPLDPSGSCFTKASELSNLAKTSEELPR
jgi:hypothetical protein